MKYKINNSIFIVLFKINDIKIRDIKLATPILSTNIYNRFNWMAEKGNTVSLREKLGTLVKKFIKYMDENKTMIFKFSELAQQGSNILKDLKRAFEIIFYFEGLGIITRVTEDHLVYVGFKGMIRRLYEYETDPTTIKLTANTEPMVGGKQVNVKSYLLGGSLLGNVFYQLIY